MNQFPSTTVPRYLRPKSSKERPCQYVYQHGPDKGNPCGALFVPEYEAQAACGIHSYAHGKLRAKELGRENYRRRSTRSKS